MKDDEYFFRVWCALMAGFIAGYFIAAYLFEGYLDALETQRRLAVYKACADARAATVVGENSERSED
jgi:16S rRNA C1402 (ribose-2'-O) methylase RsmI